MKLHPFPCAAIAVLALSIVSCKKASDPSQSGGSSAGAATSAVATGNPDDAAVLKVRWPVGGRFGHRMELTQTMQMPGMPGLPGNRPMTQETEMGQDYLIYTFKAWEQHEQRRCAALTFTGSISGNTGDPSSPIGAMMTVTGGKCSGKSWFDPARGQLIDSQIDQTIQLLMKLPGRPGAGAAPTQPVEASLKQIVSIKVVEESKK